MQTKLLSNLVEEMAGEGAGIIVDILFNKKDVNEFLIAKKMDLTINQVRNILYKLSADGLVSFTRKKDKRKGWYIYYWTLNTEKCLVKLEQSLIKKIEDLQFALNNRETKRYYICKGCEIEVTEEKALEEGFTCPECFEVYELSDNSGSIRDIKAKITRTEKELELIRSELEKVREKEKRKRVRANNKAEKEEKKKKEIAKAARAAARAKVAKKTVKKKKKVAKKVLKKKVLKKTKKVAKKAVKKVAKKKTVKKKATKKSSLRSLVKKASKKVLKKAAKKR